MRDFGDDFINIFNEIECRVLIESVIKGASKIGSISDFFYKDGSSNTKLYLNKCLKKYSKTEKDTAKVAVAKELRKEVGTLDESDCVCLSGDITLAILSTIR